MQREKPDESSGGLTFYPVSNAFVRYDLPWSESDKDLAIALSAEPTHGATRDICGTLFLHVKNRGNKTRRYLWPAGFDDNSVWTLVLKDAKGAPLSPKTGRISGMEGDLAIDAGVTDVYALKIGTSVESIQTVTVSYNDTNGRADGIPTVLETVWSAPPVR